MFDQLFLVRKDVILAVLRLPFISQSFELEYVFCLTFIINFDHFTYLARSPFTADKCMGSFIDIILL